MSTRYPEGDILLFVTGLVSVLVGILFLIIVGGGFE